MQQNAKFYISQPLVLVNKHLLSSWYFLFLLLSIDIIQTTKKKQLHYRLYTYLKPEKHVDTILSIQKLERYVRHFCHQLQTI